LKCPSPKYSPASPSGLARCHRWTCYACAGWLGRIETRAILLLFQDDDGPLTFLTVTTGDPDMPLRDFQRCFEAVILRLRRRYGSIDYYGTIEGTSGRFARDKKRRMHGHYLIKGVPLVEAPVAELLCRQTWEKSTLRRRGELGRSYRVTLSAVRAREAAALYVAGYLSKFEQVMDAGWGGRRIRGSQKFFPQGRVYTREMAESELLGEAAAWKEGYRGDDPAIPFYVMMQRVRREAVLESRRSRAEFAKEVLGMPHEATDGGRHPDFWVRNQLSMLDGDHSVIPNGYDR